MHEEGGGSGDSCKRLSLDQELAESARSRASPMGLSSGSRQQLIVEEVLAEANNLMSSRIEQAAIEAATGADTQGMHSAAPASPVVSSTAAARCASSPGHKTLADTRVSVQELQGAAAAGRGLHRSGTVHSPGEAPDDLLWAVTADPLQPHLPQTKISGWDAHPVRRSPADRTPSISLRVPSARQVGRGGMAEIRAREKAACARRLETLGRVRPWRQDGHEAAVGPTLPFSRPGFTSHVRPRTALPRHMSAGASRSVKEPPGAGGRGAGSPPASKLRRLLDAPPAPPAGSRTPGRKGNGPARGMRSSISDSVLVRLRFSGPPASLFNPNDLPGSRGVPAIPPRVTVAARGLYGFDVASSFHRQGLYASSPQARPETDIPHGAEPQSHHSSQPPHWQPPPTPLHLPASRRAASAGCAARSGLDAHGHHVGHWARPRISERAEHDPTLILSISAAASELLAPFTDPASAFRRLQPPPRLCEAAPPPQAASAAAWQPASSPALLRLAHARRKAAGCTTVAAAASAPTLTDIFCTSETLLRKQPPPQTVAAPQGVEVVTRAPQSRAGRTHGS